MQGAQDQVDGVARVGAAGGGWDVGQVEQLHGDVVLGALFSEGGRRDVQRGNIERGVLLRGPGVQRLASGSGGRAVGEVRRGGCELVR